MSIALIAKYAVKGRKPCSKVVAIAEDMPRAVKAARDIETEDRFLGWDFAEIQSPSLIPAQ